MGKAITQPKLLLVEGKDEVYLFKKLLSDLGIADVEVRDIQGKSGLANRLEALIDGPGGEQLTSVGIVQDADNDPVGSFDSICSALEALAETELPIPDAPLEPASGPPRVTVMIVPGGAEEGMLEDVCLASVADDPAMPCVESYFQCLEAEIAPESLPSNPAKARVRAFLAAMEWVEEACFESLQEHVQNEPPESPSTAQVHAFLASKYKPDLDLGIAAHKGYWQLDHSAFSEVRRFLRML